MRKLLTIIITAFAAALSGSAQTLTLDECVRLALQHYPTVAQYGLLERTAAYNLSNASKAWLPQGNIYVQGTWQNDVAALPDALTAMMAQQGVSYAGMEKLQYKAGVELTQQIWDGGRVAANRRAITTSEEVERRSLDAQMYDVEGRVQDIYFGILLLDERIARADKSITLMDSTLRQVRAMLGNGVATRSDCDQIEAQKMGLSQQITQLASARDSYRRIMEIFIGDSMDGRTLALPEEAGMESAYRNPQQRLFDSQLNNLSAREAGIKSASMPVMGAFASAYYGYPGFNMFKNMMSRDLSFNFMVGLKLTWNFSSLYSRKNDLSKITLERQRVQSNRETFLFNNRIAETEADGQISTLRQVMRDDERIVELRSSVLRAAQSQLRNGVIDATALLQKITDEEIAENELSLHRVQLIQALYNLYHIRNK